MSKSTNWLIDIGNTRLKWASVDALEHGDTHALAHEGTVDAGSLAAAFAAIRPGDHAWIASVASPALTAAVEAALHGCGATAVRATRPRAAIHPTASVIVGTASMTIR